eukprot:gnl/MRDRNA2_/MRDRNA2_113590_c0_seq1.p1 gnl/MRDRNA2_/MRDRNA2_113590_c0~~gnl/MRDRNA2_/MRDRNA2_113590_c0_seq1.p1  ORF type:complete len:250 (-),score=83.25 gnl/MRDRNA2_/MRDRNA2_113590_c0_seq1:85-834(-)
MGENGDDDPLVIALFEYDKGVKQKKWTLELGTPYVVGRKDSEADVEIDHPTLSRSHCTIMVVCEESNIIVNVIDAGSTNGTFVNGKKVGKDAPLILDLKELKHLMFGECQNGYRILARGSIDPSLAAAEAEKRNEEEEARKKKRMEAYEARKKEHEAKKKEHEAKEKEKKEREKAKRAAQAVDLTVDAKPRADKSKSSWRSLQDSTYLEKVKFKPVSEEAEQEAKKRRLDAGEQEEENLEIKWPKDWRD